MVVHQTQKTRGKIRDYDQPNASTDDQVDECGGMIMHFKHCFVCFFCLFVCLFVCFFLFNNDLQFKA